MEKYAGWLGKPLNVLNYQDQNQHKILSIDSNGKVL